MAYAQFIWLCIALAYCYTVNAGVKPGWEPLTMGFKSPVPIWYWGILTNDKPLIAGGDPTGTGKGGASIYGRHFDDEIHEELKHTG
jgi:hypothetical protein